MPEATRSIVAKLALVAWFGLQVVAGTTLLARHTVPLPAPASSPALAASLVTLRPPGDGRWAVFHVLSAECPCSRRIADHLIESARPQGVVEQVLLIGESPALAASLAADGFEVSVVTAAELSARFEIESAPMLLVASPTGDLRYVGGYTDRKQSLDIRDIAIIEGARSSSSPTALPVYGCAVSERLRRALDPLAALAERP